MTEDEMVGWHHRLDGHEFEQALGDGEEQGDKQKQNHKKIVQCSVQSLSRVQLFATPRTAA